MFNTTFFKFLIAFMLIIGLSSWVISTYGGSGGRDSDNTATKSSTQR